MSFTMNGSSTSVSSPTTSLPTRTDAEPPGWDPNHSSVAGGLAQQGRQRVDGAPRVAARSRLEEDGLTGEARAVGHRDHDGAGHSPVHHADGLA
jgi:hypothetical protein